MRKAVIIKAKRTPVGKVGGILKNFPPEELAASVIRDLLKETGCPVDRIDDVILGNVVGPGGNMARLSLLTAGLSVDIPGVTVDRQCGSGLEAINMACRFVQAGAGDIYIAGGVESTSLAPWKIEKPPTIYDHKPPKIFTKARFSPDHIGDPDMGVAAENVAEKYDISRKDQDRYALFSHLKAAASQRSGRFDKEITPLEQMTDHLIDKDECPRPNTSIEKLERLKPVFTEDGTVTAGNACPVNDGAAAALVMSAEKAKELGLSADLEFIDAVTVGVDPNILGIGPVPAVKTLISRNNISINDISYVEFNEAFASQVLASLRNLDISEDIVNHGGGALALGHPYGASGAILVTRLCTEASNYQGEYMLATLGVGGGMGMATLFKSIVS
ncbi:thiolase family protein [Scopulibacillus cellulosilyticus]|uniref:Thiolase family protein n=1 Tax=Scopulibacillus cellulosilyticus TaxID=2665665 RepID=A0ABW2PVQ2_9BACL